MSIETLLNALTETEFANAIRESSYLFPSLETIHVFALALVVGSIAMLDLRLLRVSSRNIKVTQLSAEILPWTWCAFALAAISGFLLFSSNAPKYAANFAFQAKMVLLVLAGLNMLLFHFITYKSVHNWNADAPTPTLAKVAGALSLTFWILVVACGRWIGFTI